MWLDKRLWWFNGNPIFICIHTHTHTYIHIYIYILIHTHTCIYIYIYIYIHRYVYKNILGKWFCDLTVMTETWNHPQVLSASAWSLGAPTEHEGWQWGHIPQSSPWFHVLSCRNSYQGPRGPRAFVFPSENAGKKTQTTSCSEAFGQRCFKSPEADWNWLSLIMAAMVGSRPQANTPFSIFCPKNFARSQKHI